MLCKRKVKVEQIQCLIRHSIYRNVNSTSEYLMKFSDHKIEKKKQEQYLRCSNAKNFIICLLNYYWVFLRKICFEIRLEKKTMNGKQ